MAERDPDYVDANQRYATAGQETIARIQARDLAVAGFVTLAGTVITVCAAHPEYQWIAVSIGYFALAAALLSCHHDIIIGELGLFQHKLCRSREWETNWFSKSHFDETLKARHLRDWYFAFLVFVGGFVGLAISFKQMSGGKYWYIKSAIWLLSLASVVGALYYIAYAYKRRSQQHEKMHHHSE